MREKFFQPIEICENALTSGEGVLIMGVTRAFGPIPQVEGKAMLPIDTLTEGATALLATCGHTPDTLYAAVRLDRAQDGELREITLALTEGGLLFRIDPEKNTIEEFSLTEYTHPYADSLLSAVRLFATYTPKDGGTPHTVALGDGMPASRGRLFVFLSVWEALERGERMTGTETLFDTATPPARPPRERAALRRIVGIFLERRGLFLLALLCLAAEIGLDLLRPYLSGTVLFDEIIAEGGRWHGYLPLFLCLGGIILLALLRWLAILFRNTAMRYILHPASARLRGELFEKMQSMSMSYFTNSSFGRLSQYLNSDVAQIQRFFSESASLIIYAVEFVGVALLLFLLNWRLSLFILVPIPLIFLIYRYAFPHLRRLDYRAARENSAVSSYITDSLNGVRVVKAFSKEEEEAERLSRRLTRLYRVNLQANLLTALLGPAVALLIYLANQTIWGVGGLYVMEGVITYGEFCTYLGYIGMVFAPLNTFATFATTVGQTTESATRIASLLDATPEVTECETPIVREHLAGDIEFRDVSFHYVPNRPILRGLSFKIHAGEHIGLVGQTGAGKSTIANLLLRMYDVTGGAVTVDGVDVRELSFATLRSRIAIVSQEIHIFLGTVADNIRFGKPTATDEEVVAAARAAGAHDFIMALPEGYETVIGRGGAVDLSGGERQRISIARAIVTEPDILILDEATAAMDNETEGKIAAALDRLIEGKTTLSIAHRLSSLRGCDRLMAIEGGRLAEMGTREELLARDGVFKKLYTLQHSQLEQVLKGETENESC